MMKQKKTSRTKLILTGVGILITGLSSGFALSYDQDVTNNVIYGAGNDNGGWTVDQNNGIELGLRTHVRLPVPQNVYNSNGDGTYSYSTWDNQPPVLDSKVNWNYDFSINSDYINGVTHLTTYTYILSIDIDPTAGVNFVPLDPLSVWSDNSYGDNTTPQGTTVGEFETDDPANWNLAQNSQNLGWVGANGNLDATYDFKLSAYDGSNKLAETYISVIVGQGGAPVSTSVPDGGATAGLLGFAFLGLMVARRKFAR